MIARAVSLEYRHVDVFSEVPFAGNGLIVAFGETRNIDAGALVHPATMSRAASARTPE
jgi:hypothetical protein